MLTMAGEGWQGGVMGGTHVYTLSQASLWDYTGGLSHDSILTVQPVGPGDQTQVISVGGKHIYPLSYLAGTKIGFY